jgi:hypothetical protein
MEKLYNGTYTVWGGSKFQPEYITGITYDITRPSAHPYIMGSPNPRSFGRPSSYIEGEITSEQALDIGDLFDVKIEFLWDDDGQNQWVSKTLYNVKITGMRDEVYLFTAREIGPRIPIDILGIDE